MFLRLKRSYYIRRLRLLEREILSTQADIFTAQVERNLQSGYESALWLEVLEGDKRKFTYRLAQLPIPT